MQWFDSIYQTVLQYGVGDPGQIPFMSSRLLYLVFALIVATPGLSMRRRVAGIGGAILLYLLIDRMMILVWQELPYTQRPGPVPAKEFYTNVYYMFMHWMLPFLLWIVVAYREIEMVFTGEMPARGRLG